MISFTFAEAEVELLRNPMQWLEGEALVWPTLVELDDRFCNVDAASLASYDPALLEQRSVQQCEDGKTRLDAADTVWDVPATMSAKGVIVTLDNKPVSYNYLGGVNTVAAGVMTIMWNPVGIVVLDAAPDTIIEIELVLAVRSVQSWLSTAVPL